MIPSFGLPISPLQHLESAARAMAPTAPFPATMGAFAPTFEAFGSGAMPGVGGSRATLFAPTLAEASAELESARQWDSPSSRSSPSL